jgi:hypothetical protein
MFGTSILSCPCLRTLHTQRKRHISRAVGKNAADAVWKKCSRVALDLFSLSPPSSLDLDLEGKHPYVEKERRMRIGERESTFCSAPFNKSKGETSPLRKAQF